MRNETRHAAGVTYIGPRTFVIAFCIVAGVFFGISVGLGRVSDSFEPMPADPTVAKVTVAQQTIQGTLIKPAATIPPQVSPSQATVSSGSGPVLANPMSAVITPQSYEQPTPAAFTPGPAAQQVVDKKLTSAMKSASPKNETTAPTLPAQKRTPLTVPTLPSLRPLPRIGAPQLTQPVAAKPLAQVRTLKLVVQSAAPKPHVNPGVKNLAVAGGLRTAILATAPDRAPIPKTRSHVSAESILVPFTSSKAAHPVGALTPAPVAHGTLLITMPANPPPSGTPAL